jgi:hypothetical protein
MTEDIIRQPPCKPITMTVSQSRGLSLMIIIVACFFLPSCTSPAPKQAAGEVPVASSAAPAKTAQPGQAEKATPPDLKKVEEAVRRVFKDTALIDTSHQPTLLPEISTATCRQT